MLDLKCIIIRFFLRTHFSHYCYFWPIIQKFFATYIYINYLTKSFCVQIVVDFVSNKITGQEFRNCLNYNLINFMLETNTSKGRCFKYQRLIIQILFI